MRYYNNRSKMPPLAKGYTIIDIVNHEKMNLIDFRIKRSLNNKAIKRYLNYAIKHCVQRIQYTYFLKQLAYFEKFEQIHLTATPITQYEKGGF